MLSSLMRQRMASEDRHMCQCAVSIEEEDKEVSLVILLRRMGLTSYC